MPNTSERRINVRATDDDIAHVERLRDRLHSVPHLRNAIVTQRMVILEALDALDRLLDEQSSQPRKG